MTIHGRDIADFARARAVCDNGASSNDSPHVMQDPNRLEVSEGVMRAYLALYSGHYHEPSPRRRRYFAFGVVLTVIGVAFSLSLLRSPVSYALGQVMFNVLFVGMFFSCGLGLMLTSLRYRLTLSPDALTLRRAYFTRTILRSDIAGYRMRPNGYGDTVILSSRVEGASTMRFMHVVKDEGALMVWLALLPNLDADGSRSASH